MPFGFVSALLLSKSRSDKDATAIACRNSFGAFAAMLSAAILAGSTLFSSAASAQDSSTRYGMGGRTNQFGQIRKQMDATGQQFRIEGHCQSACTMFLRMKNACVEPSAELLFHAGETPQATQRMMNSYNGALRSYLAANHYMETTSFHTISGQDIIRRFGYRACKPK